MTRPRLSRFVLAAALAITPAVSVSLLPPVPALAGGGGAAKGKESEMQKHMEVIEESMKKLRRTLRAADQNADSLKTIAELKKAATACKTLVPAMASKVPEAEREKFIASYKKDLDAFITEVDKMEKAVKDNKNDDAYEIHKKLKEIEDASHEKYNK